MKLLRGGIQSLMALLFVHTSGCADAKHHFLVSGLLFLVLNKSHYCSGAVCIHAVQTATLSEWFGSDHFEFLFFHAGEGLGALVPI